ncbi:MAG: hypothetical protein QOJ39_3108 [Candidatus Eremiobacteraeota bacterium]|jgi:hypothetical protein|nr:hypothetical protein [Candidatus Eremiobacteraeota bacterium]
MSLLERKQVVLRQPWEIWYTLITPVLKHPFDE